VIETDEFTAAGGRGSRGDPSRVRATGCVHFQDGAIVQKGDVFLMNPRRSAEVDRDGGRWTAKAQLARTQSRSRVPSGCTITMEVDRGNRRRNSGAGRGRGGGGGGGAEDASGRVAARAELTLELRNRLPITGRVSRAEVTRWKLGRAVAAGRRLCDDGGSLDSGVRVSMPTSRLI